MINWNIFFTYTGPNDDPQVVKDILKERKQQLIKFATQELDFTEWVIDADDDVLIQLKIIRRTIPRLTMDYWREQAKIALRRNGIEITEDEDFFYVEEIDQSGNRLRNIVKTR